MPLRLEIGPKDIEKSTVVLARRDTREKSFVPMDGLPTHVARAARRDSDGRCISGALTFREEHTTRVATYDEFKAAMEGRPGLRDRVLVRDRRVRGANQSRDAGDDPQHPVRERQRGRDVREVRQGLDASAVVRQVLLTVGSGLRTQGSSKSIQILVAGLRSQGSSLRP